MTYSVWNPLSKSYDYFETPVIGADLDSPNPRHIASRGTSELGFTVEDAAWPLPANAVRSGSGKAAQGMIAKRTQRSTMLGDFDISVPSAIGVYVAVGVFSFCIYKLFWNEPK